MYDYNKQKQVQPKINYRLEAQKAVKKALTEISANHMTIEDIKQLLNDSCPFALVGKSAQNAWARELDKVLSEVEKVQRWNKGAQ